LLQHLLLTLIINTSHSCGHTLKPVWISRRQTYWLWLILKHLWTPPMHIDLELHTHMHTLTDFKYQLECLHQAIVAISLQLSDAQSGLKWGKNNRFGSDFFLLAGQCFPEHLRTWFPYNNRGELLWLLFNQARQTLIFEELQNYGLFSWSVDDWHF